ncbi:MAG: glutamyl-tRNA reductase [Candidatus Brocadiia bacterium]
MNIRVAGLNHRTAPVKVRESLAFPRHRVPEALSALRAEDDVEEAVVLSTCNRVEVYACGLEGPGEGALRDFLASFHGVWPETLESHLYEHEGAQAVAHLFRVASGLDSMVVGEAQVTGQVREAYRVASEAGAAGRVFHRLFQQALAAAKRVRTRTDVAAGRASVGSVAVDLAERIFESLSERTVLVVGAGKMGETVLRSLRAAGAQTTMVANRTYERAQALARECGGRAVRFDELAAHLGQADIVIASTDAPHYVLRRSQVAQALEQRRGRPLFLIDISVPRDIEPQAADLEGCYLYNIDDLQAVVDATLARRRRELGRCADIIDEDVDAFMQWLERLEVGPTIAELSQRLHELKRRELDDLLNRAPQLDEAARAEVERMANRLVNKILHEPIKTLRQPTARQRSESLLTAALRLFGLR